MKKQLIKTIEQKIEKYEKELLKFHNCFMGVVNVPKKCYLLGRIHELEDFLNELKEYENDN